MQHHSSLHTESFFDSATSSWSHLVLDRRTRHCALIDTVLDYEPRSGRLSAGNATRILERVHALQATVEWILETHIHADHVSAARWLQRALGGRIGVGRHIQQVRRTFEAFYHLQAPLPADGSPFDQLFDDGDSFRIGDLVVQALHTPGHTPACMTYVVRDPACPADDAAAFVGDTLFTADYGTARCDFPGGDAQSLYRSINKVLSLPGQTRLYLCHDYAPGGREVQSATTVNDQRMNNIHVRDGITEQAFVTMRRSRDAQLELPVLMLPSVQMNLRAGDPPPPESDGRSYLKIPLTLPNEPPSPHIQGS